MFLFTPENLCSRLFLVSAAVASIVLASLASGQEGSRVIAPGSTYSFSSAPDAVEVVPGPPSGCGASGAFAENTPLRGFALTHCPLEQDSARVYQYHEFEVSSSNVVGDDPGTVLAATLSGSMELRGFVFILGAATASANVALKLFDVTVDPKNPRLVWCNGIKEYEREGVYGVGVGAGADVKLEGGFPYIGAGGGGSICASLGIPVELQMIRDEVDFSFGLLVQRGRKYRVQLELSVATHTRTLGGTAIACFASAGEGVGAVPVVPNPWDPTEGTLLGTENTWLSFFTKPSISPKGQTLPPFRGCVDNYGMRKGDADITSGQTLLGTPINIWQQGLEVFFNSLNSGEENRIQSSSRFLATLFGNREGAAVQIENLVHSPFMNMANLGIYEDLVNGGVSLSGLSMTIQNDAVEMQNRTTNRFIEESLLSRKLLASLYLPQASGGDLERVIALVDRMISESANSGLNTSGARISFGRAVAHSNAGEYLQAYRECCEAYRRLAGNANRGN